MASLGYKLAEHGPTIIMAIFVICAVAGLLIGIPAAVIKAVKDGAHGTRAASWEQDAEISKITVGGFNVYRVIDHDTGKVLYLYRDKLHVSDLREGSGDE